MAKDKKKGSKSKANIFKVAGAKSLKKAKAKTVNLGLKNMKQKIVDIDKQLMDIKNTPKPTKEVKQEIKSLQTTNDDDKVTKEEVALAAEQIVKMDL